MIVYNHATASRLCLFALRLAPTEPKGKKTPGRYVVDKCPPTPAKSPPTAGKVNAMRYSLPEFDPRSNDAVMKVTYFAEEIARLGGTAEAALRDCGYRYSPELAAIIGEAHAEECRMRRAPQLSRRKLPNGKTLPNTCVYCGARVKESVTVCPACKKSGKCESWRD